MSYVSSSILKYTISIICFTLWLEQRKKKREHENSVVGSEATMLQQYLYNYYDYFYMQYTFIIIFLNNDLVTNTILDSTKNLKILKSSKTASAFGSTLGLYLVLFCNYKNHSKYRKPSGISKCL